MRFGASTVIITGMWLTLITSAALLLHTLGVIAAMHAVVHTRTPQGAMAWSLGLVLLPYLFLVPYLYLGASRFLGYTPNDRRPNDRRPNDCRPNDHRPIDLALRRPAGPHAATARLPELGDRYGDIAALLDTRFEGGHRLRLLINGQAAFEAMFAAIAAAEQCVLVQFFIICDDHLGQRLQRALLERAAAGVAVYVLYDSVGSRKLPRHYVDALRAGGVAIHRFATRRWRNRFQLNFRNHRKIVVVDDAIGFVGGLNVGDEYLGARPPLSPWRDTHLQIEGPAVAQLQRHFAADWQWITGQPLASIAPPAVVGDAQVLVVATGPADPQESGSLFFTAAIHAARQRVWLSSPYFVPDAAVNAALRLAVLRGVDVRVLIPARPDHMAVFLASSLYAHEAVCEGVRIFRFLPGFLHQKALLIDDDTAMIGSMNLDNRSFRLNFEIGALVVDRDFAAQVQWMLQRDLDASREIVEDDYRRSPYLRRVAMHVARLFDPIL